MNESQQLRLLELFVKRFKPEYEAFPRDRAERPYEYYVNNGAFESVDGEVLYCMIRHFRPKTIIEIGAGYSTYLAAWAIRRNCIDEPGYRCEL